MASNDVLCIINLLKSAGDAKLASEPGRTSRSKTSKPGDTEDNSVKEVPPYILECLTVLVKNITEREDLKRQELKEKLTADFDTKLAAKDVIIKGLEKKRYAQHPPETDGLVTGFGQKNLVMVEV